MKALALMALFTTSLAQAVPLQMKPGLWKIDMTVKGSDGKEVNPSKALHESLAKLPLEQRKMIEEKLGQLSVGTSENGGMEVCYSQKMIDKPESLGGHEQGKCESKMVSQTAREIKSTFSCKDGTSGDSHWKLAGGSSYEGVVNVNSPEKGKSVIVYNGRMLSKDCGKVKPLEVNLK